MSFTNQISKSFLSVSKHQRVFDIKKKVENTVKDIVANSKTNHGVTDFRKNLLFKMVFCNRETMEFEGIALLFCAKTSTTKKFIHALPLP